MTCPSCEKDNKCPCDNCIKDDRTNLVIILEDENLYQCSFCGHKFDEQDSLDSEWNNMTIRFSERATPELCLEWISSSVKEKKELEKIIGVGEFVFEQSFRIHFNISHEQCDSESIKRLKRDSKIKSILD